MSRHGRNSCRPCHTLFQLLVAVVGVFLITPVAYFALPNAGYATAATSSTTYIDAPINVPHYVVTFTSHKATTEAGTIAFIAQDGRKTRVASILVNKATTPPSVSSTPSTLGITMTIGNNGLTLPHCTTYLSKPDRVRTKCSFIIPTTLPPYTTSNAQAGTSVTPATTNPSCISSPTDFANAFLNAIPEPDTSQNVEAVIAWEDEEGGNWKNTAKFNPMNTTQPEPGSYDINGPYNVQAYTSWTEGVTANKTTILNGYYGNILAALNSGNTAYRVATAIDSSTWGSHTVTAVLGQAYTPPNPPWQPACPTGPTFSGIVGTPSGNGYWQVTTTGAVRNYGSAPALGTLPADGITPADPVVGMVVTPTGNGYWLVTSGGGIFAFGSAGFHGSMGGQTLAAPVVGMARTPTGGGYWLVGSDGGLYAFGNAQFNGNCYTVGGCGTPIVGMAVNPAGSASEYWFVGQNGGVFSFGAPFYGSMGGQSLNGPIVGMASSSNGGGYWLATSTGGVFAFGNAGFYGSMSGQSLNAPVDAIGADWGSGGYWLSAQDGGLFAFNAPFYGSGA